MSGQKARSARRRFFVTKEFSAWAPGQRFSGGKRARMREGFDLWCNLDGAESLVKFTLELTKYEAQRICGLHGARQSRKSCRKQCGISLTITGSTQSVP